MYSSSVGDKSFPQIEKIKFLADEMAKRKIEMEQMINELKEEAIINKIMIPQSTKHRSQVFINRKKKKMLNYFSLNRGSSEDIIKNRNNNQDKVENKKKRRKSTILIKTSKKFNKDFSPENKIQTKNFNKENYDKLSGYISDSIIDFTINENEEEKKNEGEENNNKNENSKIKKNNYKIELEKKKYEIEYVDPREIKIIYDKDYSPLYNNINNTMENKSNNQDKGRNLYDKEMKLLKIKNNKLEKKRQILENKNKDFFHVSIYLNANSMKKVFNNPDYQPIKYKAIEEYSQRLTKIEMEQKKKQLKRKNEEKKEIDEIVNYNKLKKRNYSQIGRAHV